MAKCSKCGATNPEGKKFCGECGEKITQVKSEAKPASLDNNSFYILIAAIIGAGVVIGAFILIQNSSSKGATEPVQMQQNMPAFELPPVNNTPIPVIPQTYCGDGICNSNENYVTCSSDCVAPIPTGTPQYIEVATAEIANWDADAAPDGILAKFKVYDSSGRQIAVSGSLTAELEVTCYDNDWNPVTATVKQFSGSVSTYDFEEMFLKLTGASVGIVGEKQLPFITPLKLSDTCSSGTLHFHLTVGGRTYSADSYVMLP